MSGAQTWGQNKQGLVDSGSRAAIACQTCRCPPHHSYFTMHIDGKLTIFHVILRGKPCFAQILSLRFLNQWFFLLKTQSVVTTDYVSTLMFFLVHVGRKFQNWCLTSCLLLRIGIQNEISKVLWIILFIASYPGMLTYYFAWKIDILLAPKTLILSNLKNCFKYFLMLTNIHSWVKLQRPEKDKNANRFT